MRFGRPIVVAALAAMAVAMAVASSFPSPARAGGFVLLVNRANSVSSMSRSEVKHAITGATKQWPSGAVVQLGIIPGDAPETQYFATIVDLSPRELVARIQEAVFKGELRRPAVLRSSADCTAFARSNAGALCVASDGEALPPEVHAVGVH